ncbi:MAG: hypothetical protein WEA29_09890 [Acidimicrobiia bacterium]
MLYASDTILALHQAMREDRLNSRRRRSVARSTRATTRVTATVPSPVAVQR